MLWKIHHWTGLYSGIFILILSVSGAVLVFQNEVDRLLNSGLYRVNSGEREPHSLQVVYDHFQSVQQTTLEAGFSREVWQIPEDRLSPWRVTLRKRKKEGAKSETREFFIDPYTLEMQQRDPSRTFNAYITNLHFRLYQGRLGKTVVGCFAIVFLVTIVTGVFIYGRFVRNLDLGEIRRSRNRNFLANSHKWLGGLTLLFNLVIAVTAIWMSFDRYLAGPLRLMLPVDARAVASQQAAEKRWTPTEDRALKVNLDKILAVAAANFPELLPVKITISSNGSGTVTVAGRLPGHFFREGTQRIAIDKQTYQEVSRRNVAEMSVERKIDSALHTLHHGRFGGFWSKSLYCLFGLLTGVMSISGYFVYLARTHDRAKGFLIRCALLSTCILVGIYVLTRMTNAANTQVYVLWTTSAAILFFVGKGMIRFALRKVQSSQENL